MATTDTSKAEIQQQDGRIQVTGKLDVRGACQLYPAALDFGSGDLTVDISAVEELDSAGLALLVHWHQLAAARDIRLTLHGVGERAENLIQISGLESLLGQGESRVPGD